MAAPLQNLARNDSHEHAPSNFLAHHNAHHHMTKFDGMQSEAIPLEQMVLFQGLSVDELAEIKSHLRPKAFPANASILSMAQKSGVVYFLQRGTIKILSEDRYGTRAILAIVGRGDVLGEISAVDGLGHSA